MGKPFSSELQQLPATCEMSHAFPVTSLAAAIESARFGPVYSIGTGGSFSTAEFATTLFEERGAVARTVTPLTFLQSAADIRGCSIFLFTAGGNNKDVLTAFDAAIDRKAARIVNVCANKRSKLGQRAANKPTVEHIAFDTPAGRDGYLATNSLFATVVILARAFYPEFTYGGHVPTLLQHGRIAFDSLFPNSPPKHLLVLFSKWGRLAAVDLESKLSEGGLSASMVADFRHFAHGRHNWIDKQRDTALVSFSDSEDSLLAAKTVEALPKNFPRCCFHTDGYGPQVSISQLLNVFGFVEAFGKKVAIDPGRPGVPDYGSKLYHLGPLQCTRRKATAPNLKLDLPTAVDRKLRAANLPAEHSSTYITGAKDFVKRLTTASFGALVVDIDGTILPENDRNGPIPKLMAARLVQLVKAGLVLVFATGRGDSIQDLLKSAFPKETRDRVYVGYLNGAFCLPLTQCEDFASRCTTTPHLETILKLLQEHPILSKIAILRDNKCQLTIRPRGRETTASLLAILQAEISAKPLDCRIVTSTHSIDIVPAGTSKGSCINFATNLLDQHQKVIAIGDSGCLPGNDFELLCHDYSLSVGTVSPSPSKCWNLLPRELSHVDGTYHYLKMLKLKHRGAMVQV